MVDSASYSLSSTNILFSPFSNMRRGALLPQKIWNQGWNRYEIWKFWKFTKKMKIYKKKENLQKNWKFTKKRKFTKKLKKRKFTKDRKLRKKNYKKIENIANLDTKIKIWPKNWKFRNQKWKFEQKDIIIQKINWHY